MRCSSVRSSRYAVPSVAASSRPTYPPAERAASPSRVVAGAQRLVGPAVHELEQLHRELDVAQPAGAELELAVGLGRGMCCSTRRRMACTSSTKFSRDEACHTIGCTASQ